MASKFENIYKTARNSTNLSQENAAEFIGVSKDTISNYETYKFTPDDVTVFKLAKLYNTSWLIWAHLLNCTEYGKILPEVKIEDIRGAWMEVESASEHFNDISRMAREIIKDGKITKDEQKDCDAIIFQAMKVASASLSLAASLKEEEQKGERAK